MGKGRDFRGPRRRGFDDDVFSPRDSEPYRPPRAFGGGGGFGGEAAAEGPILDATVKWFNPEKGFGFVELADGSGDVFLHIGVLQSAGHDAVPPGAKMRVNVGQGQKGRQITRVVEVDKTTATEAPRRSGPRPGGPMGGPGGGGPRFQRGAPRDLSNAVDLNGSVKWFNRDKGFGFVAAEDGAKDVFVHISVVEGAGLSDLREGQAVAMRVIETPKGREAVSISVAG